MLTEIDSDLKKIVRGAVKVVEDRDDILQEVRIYIWQALPGIPDDGRDKGPLLRMLARRQIARIIDRKRGGMANPWTGAPSAVGKRTRDFTFRSIDVDSNIPDMGYFGESLDLDTPIVVRDAVTSLNEEDREYVYLRFWIGMQNKEIADLRGCTEKKVENRWTKRIKPQLREALA